MMTLTRWMIAIATSAAFMLSLLASKVALAQPGQMAGSTNEMTCHCPMAGMQGMGIAGMIVGAVLLLSIIAVLVALTIFLVRRSRTHVP